MPSQSPHRPATGRGPRHAATPDRTPSGALTSGTGGFPHVTAPVRSPSDALTGGSGSFPHVPTSGRALSDALTGGTGGFPHVTVLEGETTLGRHRRPESLADATVLRPPTTERIAGGRRASLDLTPRSRSSHSSRPARAPSGASRASATKSRGKHARAADPLAITVRPLPAVRDAAGALRDWARSDSGKPPVTGAHRAPGTLPIESWLLVGRHRQQALLATLVAVGLMLIVLPMQRGGETDVNPINAADQAVVTVTTPARKPPAKQEEPVPAAPIKQQSPDAAKPPAASQPPAGRSPAPATPPSAAPSTPAILVPQGTGPGKSLRTTGTSTVALTFDDGPDPVQTPRILELLDDHRVKATFCLVGSQARRHPGIVRDIAAAGHTLCNHTWDHSLTIGKDKPEQIRADLARTNEAIRAAVPGAAIPFFRAPGGNFTDRLVETAYADGMTSLYWEVDPRDWEHPEEEDRKAHVEKIVKSVQLEVRPGAIVLSHDFNQPDTITAYEKLLPWLKSRFTLGLPSQPPPPAAPPAASAPASTKQ